MAARAVEEFNKKFKLSGKLKFAYEVNCWKNLAPFKGKTHTALVAPHLTKIRVFFPLT